MITPLFWVGIAHGDKVTLSIYYVIRLCHLEGIEVAQWRQFSYHGINYNEHVALTGDTHTMRTP